MKPPKSGKASVPVKKAKKKRSGHGYTRVEWVEIGVDISTYSISLGGLARTKEGKLRSGAISHRWHKGTDYFIRLRDAAKAHDLVHELFQELKVMPEIDEVYLAIEEPAPFGMFGGKAGKFKSISLKQQCEINGSFKGGLARWGWVYIYEIQANQWRKVVADDLGLTIHKSKFGNLDVLPLPDWGIPIGKDNVGKYRAQQWVELFHPKWDGHWPDLIHAKEGLIPRAEGRKAAGTQPDDRYDALAIAEWMRREIKAA